jgi:hypothetical protein
MSTDVERIAHCLQLFHNLWATPMELVIAVYLLEKQIGAACAIPVILALGTSSLLKWINPRELTRCRMFSGVHTTFYQGRKGAKSMAHCNSGPAERYHFAAELN